MFLKLCQSHDRKMFIVQMGIEISLKTLYRSTPGTIDRAPA